jgi:hypothetical protein
MTLIHIAMFLFMLIRHDNISSVGFHLNKQEKKFSTIRKRHFIKRGGEDITISKVSQSVPLPFLKTSSAMRGMIVQRENVNGWTYFIYR